MWYIYTPSYDSSDILFYEAFVQIELNLMNSLAYLEKNPKHFL